MKATIYGKVNTFRQIEVYEDGDITEFEYDSSSSLGRWRTIYNNGYWEISYKDKETLLEYGPAKGYCADGTVFKGEMYEDKEYGYWEVFNAHGYWEIGELFDGEAIGEWKIIKKDGTKETINYD